MIQTLVLATASISKRIEAGKVIKFSELAELVGERRRQMSTARLTGKRQQKNREINTLASYLRFLDKTL